MEPLERLMSELKSLGLPVFPVVAQPTADNVLPNDYIVVTLVDARPEVYGGDTDLHGSEQLRATWYSRAGNTGHAKKMRHCGRDAGFIVLEDGIGYDAETKHYSAFQEFMIEREDD